jgi:subtilisin family serine protease
MTTEVFRRLRQSLAIGLIVALICDGFALSAIAVDGGDRPVRIQPSPVLAQADDDDDDDDDDDCEVEDDDGNPNTDGFCGNQIIVRLATGADPNAVNETFGTETIDAIDGQRLLLLRLPRNSDEVSFAAQLEADARVAWAELNFVDQAPEGSPRRFYPSSSGAPRPGRLNEAYAPALIGVPAAMACATGDGVNVAVIDSGLDPDHPAFANATRRGEWNAFSNQDGAGNVDDIGNSEDDDGDGAIDEMTGHGTHVAGIVTQIAPDATIMPIKALDSDGMGQAFYLSRAMYRAIDWNADIINLSLGSTANTRIVREAAADAMSAGIFVTAAAGNSGPSGLREYPATLDGVFGVAATDYNDRPADFTSRHASLALSAPGADIVSAFATDQPPSDKLGSLYALWSGTSMATPWVAGAAALLLDRHPGWSPADIATRLRNSAAPINGSGAGMGSGRLDVAAAVGCESQAQPKDDGKKDKKGKKGKKGKQRR